MDLTNDNDDVRDVNDVNDDTFATKNVILDGNWFESSNENPNKLITDKHNNDHQIYFSKT